MLNKPKFMRPSTNMQECVVDVKADELLFSCIVDGNEAINSWRIRIYRLTDNVLVYDTDTVTFTTPFFPINEKNQNITFEINLKDYPSIDVSYTGKDEDGNSTTITPEFINLPDAYYWNIEFTGLPTPTTSGNSTISCEEVFYANSTPELSLLYGKKELDGNGKEYINYVLYTAKDSPIELTSREYFFKTNYIQDEGVQLKRYGWRITDIDSGQVFVDTITHNQIYGTADNIICHYDGFLNDSTYGVQFFIETQNNFCITSDIYLFKISYEITFLDSDFQVENLKNEPAILLNWKNVTAIGGKILNSDGEVKVLTSDYFKDNYPVEISQSVVIPNGHSVIFDSGISSNLDIDENCYIVLSSQIPNGNTRTLFSIEGIDNNGDEIIRKLSFDSGVFTYSVLGKGDILESATYNVNLSPSRYTWYTFMMSPLLSNEDGSYYVTLTVTESHKINGLYPSKTQYPSQSLYPYSGEWNNLKEGE